MLCASLLKSILLTGIQKVYLHCTYMSLRIPLRRTQPNLHQWHGQLPFDQQVQTSSYIAMESTSIMHGRTCLLESHHLCSTHVRMYRCLESNFANSLQKTGWKSSTSCSQAHFRCQTLRCVLEYLAYMCAPVTSGLSMWLPRTVHGW